MEHVTIAVGRCPRCGELWPACSCGRPTPPEALDHLEPEPPAEPEPEPVPEKSTAAAPLVEWVNWRGKRGELSRYHVRLRSGGFLLCGRTIPPDSSPAADSFAPEEKRCRVCVSKVPELS